MIYFLSLTLSKEFRVYQDHVVDVNGFAFIGSALQFRTGSHNKGGYEEK
jgi:hypothetical protein